MPEYLGDKIPMLAADDCYFVSLAAAGGGVAVGFVRNGLGGAAIGAGGPVWEVYNIWHRPRTSYPTPGFVPRCNPRRRGTRERLRGRSG